MNYFTRVKQIALMGLLIASTAACAGGNNQYSMNLAMSQEDARQRYSHLYKAIDEGTYEHNAFDWVDYKKLPRPRFN